MASLWHRRLACRWAGPLFSAGQCRASSGAAARIATVDLSPFRTAGSHEDRRSAAQALSAAFAHTGFAVVVGHGVPRAAADELRREAFRFFDLGLSEKLLINEGTAGGYGESPYCYMEENGAQLLGDFSRPNDVVESLYYVGLTKQSIVQALPQRPPDLKPAILAYEKGLSAMRGILQEACEVALELEPGFLASRCDSGNESIRLAHYPELTAPPAEGQCRYGAHVDSYGLTMLRLDPDHPEGLQVQLDSEWVDVPFIEDSYVLNVGACLSRWTNGLWKASVHRVLLRPGRRLSMVSGAVRPNPDTLIEAIGPAARHGAQFPPIMMQDFVAERVAMHRPSYLSEKSIPTEAVDGLSEQIRSYQR